MISTVQEPSVRAIRRPAHTTHVLSRPVPPARVPAPKWSPFEIFGTLLTTTACIHILVAGISGFGINVDPVRHHVVESPPTKILDDVKLEPPLPAPKDEAPPPEAPPPVSGPALAADIDLPPLPEVTEISAVPANIQVAFALPVTGPVRIVKDAAHASGAVGGRRTSGGPISVNTGEAYARFLLLPTLTYPTVALQRRISGSVEVEFKTTPTGEIYDIKVRSSSGHNELDNAALQNMHRGRWTGEAGYFVKNFVFVLN